MPESCTCGAQLPPDAVFCHKCGKPQRELTEVETEAPAFEPTITPPPEISLPPQLPPVSFHNPVAVRVALSMASVAALLTYVPLLNLGFVFWWVAAGFFAVYLYRRRTGELLSTRSGLRLGWMTGILTFVIMTVLFTVTMVPLALSKGGLAAIYQEQLQNMPMHDPNMDQALHLFQSPAGLATILLFTLVLLFMLIVFLCTAGGALGAKVVGRE